MIDLDDDAEQSITSKAIPTPEQQLWAAVLQAVVADYWSVNPDLRQKADQYLRNDRMEPGRFVWICSLLGQQPDHIRKLIAATGKGRRHRNVGRSRPDRRSSKPLAMKTKKPILVKTKKQQKARIVR